MPGRWADPRLVGVRQASWRKPLAIPEPAATLVTVKAAIPPAFGLVSAPIIR